MPECHAAERSLFQSPYGDLWKKEMLQLVKTLFTCNVSNNEETMNPFVTFTNSLCQWFTAQQNNFPYCIINKKNIFSHFAFLCVFTSNVIITLFTPGSICYLRNSVKKKQNVKLYNIQHFFNQQFWLSKPKQKISQNFTY